MHIYRLCKEKYTNLDGHGAFLYGGRWNLPGKAVVYAAENRALAALEFLVGIEQHRALGKLLMLTIELPDDLPYEEISIRELPPGWRQFPAPQLLAQKGNAWLERQQTCWLRVPSVQVPEEHNFLLNPGHPDFTRIKIGEQKEFLLDERLLDQ